MRERLIEILMQDPELFFDKMGRSDYENLADHLIANNVVLLSVDLASDVDRTSEGGNRWNREKS